MIIQSWIEEESQEHVPWTEEDIVTGQGTLYNHNQYLRHWENPREKEQQTSL